MTKKQANRLRGLIQAYAEAVRTLAMSDSDMEDELYYIPEEKLAKEALFKHIRECTDKEPADGRR